MVYRKDIIMNREEQLEILKMTYVFEETISKLLGEAKKLKYDKPHEPEIPIKPREPEEEKIQITPTPYPEIIPPEIKPTSNEDGKSLAKKHGLGLVLGGVLYAGYMLKNSMDESKQREEQRKRMIEEIRNSQEYKNKCLQIDEENRLKQDKMNKTAHEQYLRKYEEYKIRLQQYREDLKQYHEDLKLYNEQSIPDWIEETDILDRTIQNARNTLQALYGKNVLPLPYQNKEALSYIVSYMSSSDSNLEYVIERYDTYITHEYQKEHINIAKEQTKILRGIWSEQQYTNYLSEGTADLIAEGNSVLKNISSFQKFEFCLGEYRRFKAKRATRKRI